MARKGANGTPSTRRRLTTDDLKSEVVPIDQLRQHPQNPRASDPEAIGHSIRAHGQFRAIVISEDGFILAGNHTYQAALGEGLTEMVVHRLPVKHDSKQAIEIMLADNRTSDFSRYDDQQLARLLVELPDPTAAGWEEGDVSRFFERLDSSGFLADLDLGKGAQALMHGAKVGEDTREFKLPMTPIEREEAMRTLQHVKDRLGLPTLTLALLAVLRDVAGE